LFFNTLIIKFLLIIIFKYFCSIIVLILITRYKIRINSSTILVYWPMAMALLSRSATSPSVMFQGSGLLCHLDWVPPSTYPGGKIVNFASSFRSRPNSCSKFWESSWREVEYGRTSGKTYRPKPLRGRIKSSWSSDWGMGFGGTSGRGEVAIFVVDAILNLKTRRIGLVEVLRRWRDRDSQRREQWNPRM